MFADAVRIAQKFTRAVVVSQLGQDGTCQGGLASFVVINKAGWMLTAAHVIAQHQKLALGKAELEGYLQKKADIERTAKDRGTKRKLLKRLGRPDPAWPVNFSFWWRR